MNKDLLYKYFEGQTTLEESNSIRRWVESSPENKSLFEKERHIFNVLLLHGIKGPSSVEEFLPWYTKVLSSQWVQMGAAVILILFMFSFLFRTTDTKKSNLTMISAPAGQRSEIKFPDGSVAILNSLSTITFSDFKKERIVNLDGQAYFEVKKDKKHPFVVKTQKMNIKVLGTKFDVNAYSKKGTFETSLFEGCIHLYNETDKKVLQPNTKAIYRNNRLVIDKIKERDSYKWTEGLICFRDCSFMNVMDEFEKYFGMKIIIHNDDIMKYRFTGKFWQADGIDYALRILQEDSKFTYEKDINKKVIIIN